MKKGGAAWRTSKRPSSCDPAGLNAFNPRKLRPGQILLFALIHYVLLLALAGLIFLIIHIPPKAVSLDSLILVLSQVETVLTAPRRLFIWLWPGEATSRILIFCAVVLNSLAWGLALASLKLGWAKVRE